MNLFFSFTRASRIGIISLLVLIMLIFLASIIIRNSAKEKINIDEEKLNLAWQQMQDEHSIVASQKGNKISSLELFYFDPNSLDSAGFISLGLKEKTVHYLLNWRRKGKRFYKKEDLKPLYTLSEAEYNKLAPFVQIANTEQRPNFYEKEKLGPLPEHINLNKTDSATLVRLKGVGPFYAHKIITYRNALGGFLNHNQLQEVYRFHDSTLSILKERLIINPNEIKKINLNTATEEQLAIHPYIGEKMAKNIILLREGFKKYENISQLRQVPLMNEEKYRKIAVYCTIE